MCDFIAYELKDKWRMKRIVDEEELEDEQPELEKVQEQPLTVTQ
jgi:hypothetical protein